MPIIATMFNSRLPPHSIAGYTTKTVQGSYCFFGFSKSIAGFNVQILLLCAWKINCFSSHTSHHDWPGVYCFPSKLRVPIIFHTGSLELCYQDILDILELWRWAGWRDVLPYLFIYSAVYSVWGQVYITVHCCIVVVNLMMM